MSSFGNWGKKWNGTYCRASSNAPAKVTAKLKERRRERRGRPRSFKPSVRWPERSPGAASTERSCYRTDGNAVLGKHREQRGCLLLCEQSYSESYPTHSLWTGAFCRLIRTKIHPFLRLFLHQNLLSSIFMHQCFPFSPAAASRPQAAPQNPVG